MYVAVRVMTGLAAKIAVTLSMIGYGPRARRLLWLSTID
jgi:hypothetical protein